MPIGRIRGLTKASHWCKLFAQARPDVQAALEGMYGREGDLLQQKRALFLRAAEAFAEQFGAEAQAILVRTTGRVNLLGMHVDHRGGYVNPVAVGELIFFAQPRDDDRVVLKNVESAKFPDRVFGIADELPGGKIQDWDQWTQALVAHRKATGKAGDWSDYVKAAVLFLQHRCTDAGGRFGPVLRGMNVMVCGNVPQAAGLSSSSAVVVAAAVACRRINDLHLTDMELVDACAEAEWYVGTRGGGGDHAAIMFGRLDNITRIRAFPLSVDWIPFPPDYRIVLADSLVKAEKSAGARDIFNQRVASYEFAMMLMRKNFPNYAARLEHLRDINPRTLGVDEAEIYRILRSLPQRARRAEILEMLSEQAEQVEHVFGSHAEPPDGYRIRQVAMYGVCECLRSEMAAGMLKAGDIDGFGELVNLSHEGDRVTQLQAGRRVLNNNSYDDDRMDALIADLVSGDAGRKEQARLWRQGGGYDVSTEELDTLVDLARGCPGVVGAGLVGAGLGGCVAAIVRREQAGRLVELLESEYYRPRGLSPAGSIVRPVAGMREGLVNNND